MSRKQLLVLLLLVGLIAAFFAFDLGRFFNLDTLKSQQAALSAYQTEQPLITALLFFAVYVIVTGLSFPGAAILTLAGGAIFGLFWGTVIVSFASTLGATLAFLAARFVLRDAVQQRFGDRLRAVNEGMARDGAFYLFTLRLVPVFPFFLINLLMGLTPIRALTFYGISQLGMLPGTIVYVNAGTELAKLDSLRGILSPGLLLSFVLLGVFPLLARWTVTAIQRRRHLAQWIKPRRFDRNLIVIGAGSAGLVTAYIAAAVKAKVTLIEKQRMGGDCLNTGCVPSKALIRSARLIRQIRRADEFGLRATVQSDFASAMARVQRIIAEVAPHDSVERYTELGVECLCGPAKIVSPWQVEVRTADSAQTLSARAIVIAAGARPFIPPIPGLAEIGYLTSDTVWELRELPRRLLVLGGGPIGSELAQCFARFGSQVTQVQTGPRLLIREDPEIAERVMAQFRAEGIDMRMNHQAQQFLIENGEKILVAEHAGDIVRIPFDHVLVAVGRVANIEGYGLEQLGIPTTPTSAIETDAYLQTLYPSIFACGDVAGPFQFTHAAAHQAWYAAVNALFGQWRKFRVDYSVIPWATFTDPEVARVGLNEQEAREKNIAYEVSVYDLADLDRAIADGEAQGVVKVLTAPGRDRILGVTIVGEHAGDLIAEFVLAMRCGIGLNQILGAIHIYPTLAEANKYAAGVWKRAHAPERALRWLARYHAWRRG